MDSFTKDDMIKFGQFVKDWKGWSLSEDIGIAFEMWSSVLGKTIITGTTGGDLGGGEDFRKLWGNSTP